MRRYRSSRLSELDQRPAGTRVGRPEMMRLVGRVSTSHRGVEALDGLSGHHVVLAPQNADGHVAVAHGHLVLIGRVADGRLGPASDPPGVIGLETEDRCDREELVGVGDRVEAANQAVLDLDRDEGDRTSVADRHELTSASTGHREEHCP
jgi:hypothetical protein